jgi:UDP-glucose 4-epimerase
VVFHLAAAVGVDLVVESPVRAIETNVHCTEVVLAQANKKKKPVFVASTSEVYGKSARVPFEEDGDLLLGSTHNGRWSYACSKAMDEYLALAYHQERSLDCVIARLFNTVGPRQTGRYGMVIPRFVERALAGRPLEVHGDGTQSRSFCHVTDVVRALAGLLDEAATSGEIYNVGSTQRVRIVELAGRILELTGSTSEIRFVPYEEVFGQGIEDTLHRLPSIGKIQAAIGWAPQQRLEQILADVIAYEREAQAARIT